MAWIRYESGILAHMKWQGIPASVRPDVLALHVAFSGYSADYLTDGFVPLDMHAELAKKAGLRRRKVALSWATKQGLFEPREGGVQIHDYLDYNPSKEEVKERRRLEVEKKKRAREAKKQQMSPGDTLGESLGDSNGDVPAGQPEGRPRRRSRAHASRPVPEDLSPKKVSSGTGPLQETPSPPKASPATTLSPDGRPFDPEALGITDEADHYIDMRRRMWAKEGR